MRACLLCLLTLFLSGCIALAQDRVEIVESEPESCKYIQETDLFSEYTKEKWISMAKYFTYKEGGDTLYMHGREQDTILTNSVWLYLDQASIYNCSTAS